MGPHSPYRISDPQVAPHPDKVLIAWLSTLPDSILIAVHLSFIMTNSE